MRNPDQFWRGLEAVAGLRDVDARWRQAFGEDYLWARRWLRPTGDLAMCYPKLEAGGSPLAFRVVYHDADAGDIVGVCPEGTGTISLRRRDVLIYAFDVEGFAAQLARALDLVPDFEPATDTTGIWRIGAHSPAGGEEVQVYLAAAGDADHLWDTVTTLATRLPTPFLLLTPTKASWRAWPPALRRDRRSAVYALAEIILTTADGALYSRLSATDLLRLMNVEGQPERRPDGFIVPDLVIWRGVEHECKLSKGEGLFFNRTVGQELTPIEALMHRSKGALWRQKYQGTSGQRDRIAQTVSRLNVKLLNAKPPVPIAYSVVRGEASIHREATT
jgi:hypothetical protein